MQLRVRHHRRSRRRLLLRPHIRGPLARPRRAVAVADQRDGQSHLAPAGRAGEEAIALVRVPTAEVSRLDGHRAVAGLHAEPARSQAVLLPVQVAGHPWCGFGAAPPLIGLRRALPQLLILRGARLRLPDMHGHQPGGGSVHGATALGAPTSARAAGTTAGRSSQTQPGPRFSGGTCRSSCSADTSVNRAVRYFAAVRPPRVRQGLPAGAVQFGQSRSSIPASKRTGVNYTGRSSQKGLSKPRSLRSANAGTRHGQRGLSHVTVCVKSRVAKSGDPESR